MARQAHDRYSTTRRAANRKASRGFETLEPRAMFSASSALAPSLLSAPPVHAPAFTATPLAAHQVNLAWNEVSGATGYVVDEWTGGAWKQIANLGSGSTGYSVTGLAASTNYGFDVEAYNSVSGAWANSQSVKTGAVDTTSDPLAVDQYGKMLAYSPVSGSLFGANGPTYTDVHQGQVGDCWLLASLAEVAARDPQDIRNMFTYEGVAYDGNNAVGLYSVRLFNSAGVAEHVTVDTELPKLANGSYFADQPTNGVLWVALAEKAYALANGMDYVTSQHEGNYAYHALDSGQPYWALQAITGKPASSIVINPTNIAADWNKGDLIVVCTTTPASSDIVGGHAYAVVGYNSSSSQPFKVFNPWGTNSSGWVFNYNDNQWVYGLFNADATFMSHNFAVQSVGTGAAPGTASLSSAPQQAASVLNTSSAAQDVPPAAVRGSTASQQPLFAASTGLSAQRTGALDNLFAAWGEDTNLSMSLGDVERFHILGVN